MRAERLLLLLQRSAQQEAELQTYLRAVQDPHSPQYHHWLVTEEFGRRFGVSDADLEAVQQWLMQQGLTVSRIATGRIAIEFSGTFGQVENAFHTSLHQYVVNSEQHWANASDPQIPRALAPVVAGIVSLNDFGPHSMAIRGPSGTFKSQTGTIRPELTSGDTQNGYFLYISPADAATIYDTPTTLNPTHTAATYDGSGVTIGIAGDSNIDAQQNANYRATFGLPTNAVQVVVDGADPGENGDAIEAYLDTEVAGGIAPGANVVLYTAANTYLEPGLFLAIVRAIDSNAVDILNVSFSGCEAAQGTAGNQFIYDLWEQAAAQGISVTVSTGDSGSAGCDDQNTEQYAQNGLAVNGLASTPYNVAVGGTDFDALYSNFPSSFTQYVNVTNSQANHRSALSYISEEPWNDSTASGKNGLLVNNFPWAATKDANLQSIIAAGGGASSCVTMNGSACAGGYAVPTWQSSFAKEATGRNLPDVSFLAGNGLYGAAWALCTDQDYISSTQTQADCVGTPTTGGNFNVTGVGGTSAAAPAFAGMLALAAQKTGGRLGQADYVLYNLAKAHYATVFHDIATGNDSVSCTQGTPHCIAVTTVNTYYLSGFDTQSGFDEASGLGSVDVAQMLSNWNGAGATATLSSLTLNGSTSAVTITHGQPVSVNVDVTGSGGTPAGSVALVDNIDPARIPDSGAIATLPLSSGAIDQTVSNLPGGSYKVSAHYGGDPSFAASDSNAIPVTVNPETSTTSLKVRGFYDPVTGKSTSTPYYGYIYLLDAQPYGNSASLSAPDGVATGNVTFAAGTSTLGTATLGSNGVAELQTSVIPGGNNSLTASFPGDLSFKSSTSSAVAFTVQPAVSSLAMSTNITPGLDYNPGDNVIITATFANGSGSKGLDSLGAAPTGTINFIADGSNQLGTASVTGTAGTAASLATASATFTAKGMAGGTHSFTATYSGDGNYAASSSASPVSVVILDASTTVSLSPASATIKQNQTLQLATTLSTYGSLPAPTGTVKFTAIDNANLMSPWTSPPIQISNGAANTAIPANTLPIGTYTLVAYYSGDNFYGSGSSYTNPNLTVTASGSITPTLTLTMPNAPVNGGVPITLAVSGPSGDPVPTGTVMYSLNNGSWTLVNGSVSLTAYYPWQPGPNNITVTYMGDSSYASASAKGSFTEMSLANISVSPLNPSVSAGSVLPLTVSVSQATGLPQPTGNITVSYGTYTSAATVLSSGSASITIPANTLPVGSDVLNISYSGDANYVAVSSTDLVDVTTAPPGFTLSGGNVTLTAGATVDNTSTIAVAPTNGFSGTVTLAAQITAAPASAVNKPTLSFGSSSPVNVVAGSSGNATLIITTTASSSAMARPATHPGLEGLEAVGSVLAGVLLLVVPKRRQWQKWLGMFAVSLSILGAMSACGGSGTSAGGGGTTQAGTTPGVYTVTITGTSATLTATTTFSVTVN
jgi:hypothetical protein